MSLKGKGASMEKSKTSHCVVNIIPPRSTWTQIQMYRNRNTKDARCGPHFSFVDPFVTVENYPEAAKLLSEHLADFPPFKVSLTKFGSFHFAKSAVLFLEPEFDPPNALHNLLKKIAEIFPQCNDQVLKSKTGEYVAHMTIGSYKNKAEVERALEAVKKDYVPVHFTVHEIYLLNRVGTDPFEVKHVVQLGGAHVPHFGPGCEDEIHNSKANRSIVVLGIPNTLDNRLLAAAIKDLGFNDILGAEMILNPNLSTRPIGVVEFPSRTEADRALEAINKADRAPNSDLPPGTYAKILTHMAFPDIVGGSCSTR